MIVFVYGSDVDMVRDKAAQQIEMLRSKRPDAGFFKMDDENFDVVQFEELIFGQGLFEKKFIVYLSRAMENAEARDFLVKHLGELADSENAFVIAENKLTKPTYTKVKDAAFRTYEFEEKKTKVVDKGFNVFSLSDALGRKDKKQLWVLYTQALGAGIESIQIHGVLSSQVRAMSVVGRAEEESSSLEGSGIHPFVLSKAKSSLKYYTQDELRSMSRSLVHIYHDSRGGGEDLDTALEKFILDL